MWPVWAALVPGEEAEGSRPAGAEGLPRAPAPLDCLTPGTFYARERVAALYGFVREALQNDWLPFELLASGGQKLSEDENLAFNECGLVSDGSPHLNPTLWALVKSSQAPKRGWDGTGEVSLGVKTHLPTCGVALSNFCLQNGNVPSVLRVLCKAETRRHSKCRNSLRG